MKYAEEIQKVLNTIALLKIDATFDNMNALLGIYQSLSGIRDALVEDEQAKEKDKEKDKAAE